MELSTPETLEENLVSLDRGRRTRRGERRPFWIGMVFDRASNRWQSDATGQVPQYEIPWAPNEPNQDAGLVASLIADDPLWATSAAVQRLVALSVSGRRSLNSTSFAPAKPSPKSLCHAKPGKNHPLDCTSEPFVQSKSVNPPREPGHTNRRAVGRLTIGNKLLLSWLCERHRPHQAVQ